MFRKATTASIALIVATGFLTAAPAPASAAVKISNGVACTKAGVTSKTSAGTYKCAKKPIGKKSKLTWLSVGCLKTADSYIQAKKSLPSIKSATDTTIAELDAKIIVQQKVLADSLALLSVQQKELVEFRSLTLASIEAYKAKIVGITAKLITIKADAANLTKNSANIASYERAIKAYETAIKTYETAINKKERAVTLNTSLTSATGAISRSINQITTSRAQALTGYENTNLDVKNGLDMTKLICSKGY